MKIVLTYKESIDTITQILEQGEDKAITLFVHKKALPLVEAKLLPNRIKVTKGEYIYIVGEKRVKIETFDSYV